MHQGPLGSSHAALKMLRFLLIAIVTTSLVLSQSAVTALAQVEKTAPAENVTADETPAENTPTEPSTAVTEKQAPTEKPPADKPEKPPADKPEEKSKAPSFAVVPGPFYNPSLGLGLNVIPMLMFHPSKTDDVSPPSIVMLNLLYAIKPPFDEAGSRQSFVAAAMTRLFLDQDRWRVTGIFAYVNLFQQFYGLGGNTDVSHPQFNYRLEQIAAFGQLYRQIIWKGFYVGALLGAMVYHTKTDNPEDAAVLESIGSGSDWRVAPNVGLLSQYDSRDNKYYPTRGVNFNLRMNGSFRSGEEYFLLAPGFNQYFSLLGGDKLVLAYRIFGQFGFGNLPISAYARYGMRGTTLGYETGEYMDKKMAGVETEIRWIIWKRIGAEAGGGLGKVFAEFADFGHEDWLPGVWGSGTFKIMEKQDIRARATVAYGKSGVLFYFGVGQNF
jgi:Omp85 superfamily domain